MPNFGEPDADWTDEFAWTRYRGPQPYPCPADWVLGMVEGDGIGWKRYPGVGQGLETDSDVLDTFEPDYDAYNDARKERATLIDELLEFDPRNQTESHKHTFSIDGQDVFVRVVPEYDDLLASVAEALARYAGGEEIEEFAADVEPTTGFPPEREQSRRNIEQRREENQSLEAFSDE